MEGEEESSSVQLTAPPSGPESHELCRLLQLTGYLPGLHKQRLTEVWWVQRVRSSVGTRLVIHSGCHADYMVVFIPYSSELRGTMQVLLLFLCLPACRFKVNALVGQSAVSGFIHPQKQGAEAEEHDQPSLHDDRFYESW